MSDGCTQNWSEVEERIDALQHDCARAGDAAKLAKIVLPLKHRFYAGERSRELAEEVMALQPTEDKYEG